MNIAIPYENGLIFQHFGHTQQFKLYQTDETRVLRGEVVSANGSGHGALAGFLKERGVEALVCGGIGGGARAALDAAGIRVYAGASGSADAAVLALLKGTLSWDPDAACSHHAHGEGHDCHSHGEHDCHSHGEHDCQEHRHGCSR